MFSYFQQVSILSPGINAYDSPENLKQGGAFASYRMYERYSTISLINSINWASKSVIEVKCSQIIRLESQEPARAVVDSRYLNLSTKFQRYVIRLNDFGSNSS
jgi:hypothetical protein